jgi:hypothetical protein
MPPKPATSGNNANTSAALKKKHLTDSENKENVPDGGHSQNSAQPEEKALKDPVRIINH